MSSVEAPDITISRRRLAKNSLANVMSGASGALVAVVLPPILIRVLSRDSYTVWALILQVAAYTNLLNFGIQVAVGRFVATYDATGETERQEALVSSAWLTLIVAAAVAAMGMLLATLAFPLLFPRVPVELESEARLAMACVGLSTAVGLPFSVFMGIFIGRQRNEVPGLIQFGSRLAIAVSLAILAVRHAGLIAMGEAFAIVNVLMYGAQFLAHRIWAATCRVRIAQASWKAFRELWTFCLGLSVWNIGMVMVSGLDLIIVGHVDFRDVPAYSIAAGVVTLIVGLQNAVFNVLVPAGAILGASADEASLRRMLLNSTRFGVLLLMASSIPLLFAGRFLLDLYIGSAGLANVAFPLLQLLVIGNFIRLSAAPYAVLLIGTNQQRLVVITPLVEGVVNIIFSILLGLKLGAAGVAIGTIIGAIVAIFGNLVYNLPRTKLVSVRASEYLWEGVLRPLLSAIPLGITYEAFVLHGFTTPQVVLLFSIAAFTSISIIWQIGLTPDDRRSILGRRWGSRSQV